MKKATPDDAQIGTGSSRRTTPHLSEPSPSVSDATSSGHRLRSGPVFPGGVSSLPPSFPTDTYRTGARPLDHVAEGVRLLSRQRAVRFDTTGGYRGVGTPGDTGEVRQVVLPASQAWVLRDRRDQAYDSPLPRIRRTSGWPCSRYRSISARESTCTSTTGSNSSITSHATSRSRFSTVRRSTSSATIARKPTSLSFGRSNRTGTVPRARRARSRGHVGRTPSPPPHGRYLLPVRRRSPARSYSDRGRTR